MKSFLGTAVVAAMLASLAASMPAHAHGGGLDALGCHHDRKHGGYHCHRGPLAGRSFSSKSDAMAALEGTKHPQTQGQAKQQIGKD